MAGIRITLKETGQQSIARLWVDGVTSKIIKGYWVNSKGEKITLHPYDEPDFLYFYFESIEELINKKIILKVYDYTHKNAIVLYETKYTINAKWNTIKIPIRGDLFKYTEDKKENFNKNILRLYPCLYLDGEILFRLNKDDYLKIHVVEFVRRIMKAQTNSWNKSIQFQNIWFEGDANSEPWRKLILGRLSIKWVIQHMNHHNEYNDLKERLWKSPNAIKELKKMIKRMTIESDVNLRLPEKEGETVVFGVTSEKIKEYEVPQPKLNKEVRKEKMPLFERFYYQSKSYVFNKFLDPLNDLTGALGSFLFRVIALGEIMKEGNRYKITIKKIGIYVKDSFDFISEGEGLGIWSISKNSVMRSPYVFDEYYKIDNKSYQDYREEYKKGMDFNVYSDIEYTNVKPYFFHANKNELE